MSTEGEVTRDAAVTRAAEDLRAEISRGQQLDRDLARDLGRPEPARSAGAAGYVESLARRPLLSSAFERELVIAAQAGDPVARARLVDACMPLISSVARTYRSGRL